MKPLCVFGIVNNKKGLKIAEEMLKWLEPIYDVHKVYHDGSQFEYPALKYMQNLCINTDLPVLYIHTKGAFNRQELSQTVRAMWKYEFTINRDLYFKLVDRPYAVVACPFTGSDKTTWYNGFVANSKAMKEIPEITPGDRMKFERLFIKQTPQVVGVIRNDVHRELGHVDKKFNSMWNLMK